MGFYSNIADVFEEEGTPREEYDTLTGVTTASVVLRTPWKQKNEVVTDILDNRRQWPDLSGVTAQVITTLQASQTPPIAISASVVPQGCKSTLTNEKIVYENALITVRYSNSPVFGLVREEIRPASEFLKLKHQGIHWGGDDPDNLEVGDELTPAEAPGFYRTNWVIIRTLQYLSLPLDDDYLKLVGTVNDSKMVFTSLHEEFEPEELLYSDPSIDIQFKADGTETAKVVQRLMFREGTWNKYWRTITKSYEYQITTTPTNEIVRSYPLADWEKTGLFPLAVFE